MLRNRLRTDTEMMTLILQIADTLESRSNCFIRIPNESSVRKDEFQDYDVVYIVDDLKT